MGTVRMLIALVAMELLFRTHLVSQDTWFIGYSLIFGAWIIGGEIGRIGDVAWKLKQFASEFLENYFSDSEKEGERE